MRNIKNINYIMPESKKVTYQPLPPETIEILRAILVEKNQKSNLSNLVMKNLKMFLT